MKEPLMFRVDLDKDLEEINSWYKARVQPGLKRELLPRIGYVVQGVGAGFLITTDAGIGILEYFISNPAADSTTRHLMMDRIAKSLINLGESMGITVFMAFTKHPAIFKLCAKYKFIELSDMKVFGRIK